MNGKIKMLAIVGPTASGKTALSVELAKALDGEIICCDSMQIYKDMNIGTAKPTEDERSGVTHHLFDIAEPEEEFSLADYKTLAQNAIADVSGRGRVPILCGGTGLYLDSLLRGGELSPDIPDGLRASLEKRDPDSLWEELLTVDPEAASLTHKNNLKRVIRALEIYHGTGRTKTEWDRLSRTFEPPYDALIFGLDYSDRETLYQRIEKRVDIMLEDGLIAELDSLEGRLGKTASQAIGYKELLKFRSGELSCSEAVDLLKKNTRNYAKRQLTWFRRNKNVNWFFRDRESDKEIFEKIVNIAKRHLN